MFDKVRRDLRFVEFCEIIADAERLSSSYQQLDQWDLAQACDHLASWVSFSMDGFPQPPLTMRALLLVLRTTVGRRELIRVLSSGKMAVGAPTFRSTVMPAGRDAVVAIRRLKLIANRFASFAGPLHPSPLYGKLTYEQWRSLHLIHCAHHLGNLLPTRK